MFADVDAAAIVTVLAFVTTGAAALVGLQLVLGGLTIPVRFMEKGIAKLSRALHLKKS